MSYFIYFSTSSKSIDPERYNVNLLRKWVFFFNPTIKIPKCSDHGPLSCKINSHQILNVNFMCQNISVTIVSMSHLRSHTDEHGRLSRESGNSSAAQCLKGAAWNQRTF